MELHLWHGWGAILSSRQMYTPLTDRKKFTKDIVSLSDDDVKVAEEVLQALKPLEHWNSTIVSRALPLKTRILQSMAPSEEDRPITRDVKAAIRGVLMYRTTSIDLLSLSHLYPARRQRTYTDLTTEIVATEQGLKKNNFNSEY